jgi:hypothetical protein
MSPTYFVVHMAAADKRLEIARKAGDLRAVQSALTDQAALLRALYGVPPARVLPA